MNGNVKISDRKIGKGNIGIRECFNVQFRRVNKHVQYSGV